MIRIGIDLGGTKIEGIALSEISVAENGVVDNGKHEAGEVEAGKEIFRHRVDTPQGDYPAILQCIVDLVREVEKNSGVIDGDKTGRGETSSIGICTPGSLSPATGLMRNSNSVCMNGQPVLDDLQRLLQKKIRIANDANCFALSEATDGAASNAAVVFGVIVGTGTGAGIVINKQILVGPNSIAGEWGHNSLPWPQDSELPGPECYCGKNGCIETWLSGPGIMRDHEIHNNEFIDAETLAKKALFGDFDAIETFQRYEDRMARSLAHVINILDPDVIVLGGGMGNIKRLYENVPKLWGQYIFSDVLNTKLVAPKHGDSSGVRGAAWLWR